MIGEVSDDWYQKKTLKNYNFRKWIFAKALSESCNQEIPDNEHVSGSRLTPEKSQSLK